MNEKDLSSQPSNFLAVQFAQGLKNKVKRRMRNDLNMVSFQNDQFEVAGDEKRIKFTDYYKPWLHNTGRRKKAARPKPMADKTTLDQMVGALADDYDQE